MHVKVKATLTPNPSVEDIILLLLHNRFKTKNLKLESKNFFSPPHPTTLSLADFGFEQSYIDKAISFIWSLHPKNPTNPSPKRPIVVYTDYDADGITGGTILWETLHLLGFVAFPYTPNRIKEGYGFSEHGLKTVRDKYNPALIISVDHGITAQKLVTYANRELDIPIIVTDHHHKQDEKVPHDAHAIFHIPALSGSGVAYYVAKEIATNTKYKVKSKKGVGRRTSDLGLLFLSDYVGIAAIGTIADLVPLTGPSRAIAYHGLKELTTTLRPGLVALKHIADHIGKKVTTYEVGFLLAPRLNATGRLDDALDALRLLCTHDKTKATQLAQKLNKLNTERQDMVKRAVNEAIKIVDATKDVRGDLPKLLIVNQKPTHQTSGDSGLRTKDYVFWHEGIIGLIASKLCDMYYLPTIVLTYANDPVDLVQPYNPTNLQLSTYKASARSISGFNMMHFLESHKDLLIKFGGHEMAAGFSIDAEKLPSFIANAQSYAKQNLSKEMLERTLSVDCELPLDLAHLELAKELTTFEPYGMGNPRPVFMSTGKVTDMKRVGKDNTHARFTLTSGSITLPCIAFGKADEVEACTQMHECRMAYSLEVNMWNGAETVQGKVVHIARL